MKQAIKIEGYRRSGKSSTLNAIARTANTKPLVLGLSLQCLKEVVKGVPDYHVLTATNYSNFRGGTYSLVLIDETDYLPDSMLVALVPMLSDHARIFYTKNKNRKLSKTWKKFFDSFEDPEDILFTPQTITH